MLSQTGRACVSSCVRTYRKSGGGGTAQSVAIYSAKTRVAHDLSGECEPQTAPCDRLRILKGYRTWYPSRRSLALTYGSCVLMVVTLWRFCARATFTVKPPTCVAMCRGGRGGVELGWCAVCGWERSFDGGEGGPVSECKSTDASLGASAEQEHHGRAVSGMQSS